MTRASIREYTEAVRWQYLWAPRKEKGKILDEFQPNGNDTEGNEVYHVIRGLV